MPRPQAAMKPADSTMEPISAPVRVGVLFGVEGSPRGCRAVVGNRVLYWNKITSIDLCQTIDVVCRAAEEGFRRGLTEHIYR